MIVETRDVKLEFFYIRLLKRKIRLLFDYRNLNIMVTSVHHYHCRQVPVSDKKWMCTTSYAEWIHICAEDKGSI